ncbi:GNAT family N-acetyltransferase [Actinomadura parmotrematis]|uniref:GNAT family N-acetyltransferase n=1 Tax=Actinomadura parmotrematis TaxID=2864039 RepID=A0ABS7FL68_9ACTN|nr:GNAT family N-acetyltransferase [Actinomadura parmotrematis]MBW8481112.1 GNAT family N-acetyltransferase [Actinomadura parmotrematis]
MDTDVRLAGPGDLDGLPAIENSGDPLFAELGIVFGPGPTVIEKLRGTGAEVLVAGRPPVGFAATSPVDGAVHLEQISVRADLVRRGIGGRLLRAVIARAAAAGAPGVSLLTFRDVPFNGPWYAAHGFAVLPAERWGPGLRGYRGAEAAEGLDRLGARQVMWRPTAPGDAAR